MNTGIEKQYALVGDVLCGTIAVKSNWTPIPFDLNWKNRDFVDPFRMLRFHQAEKLDEQRVARRSDWAPKIGKWIKLAEPVKKVP